MAWLMYSLARRTMSSKRSWVRLDSRGERSGAAGIENEQAEGRRRSTHQLFQLAQLEPGRPQMEGPAVGVAGVVDQQHRGPPGGPHPLVHRDERTADRVRIPALEQDQVFGAHPADFLKHAGHA